MHIDNRTQLKRDANGGNTVLFVFPPHEEDEYIRKAGELYPEACFTDISQLFVRYIDYVGWDDFKTADLNTNATKKILSNGQMFSNVSALTVSPFGNDTSTLMVGLENGYTCEKCNNEFRIDVSLTPTLLTTPLNVGYDFDKKTEAEAEVEDVSITQEYTEGTEL